MEIQNSIYWEGSTFLSILLFRINVRLIGEQETSETSVVCNKISNL